MSRHKKVSPKPSTNGFVPGPTLPQPQPMPPKERIEACLASEIAPEKADWLWYPWVPKRELTMIVGLPNTGKSTLIAALLAHVTSDYPVLGGEKKKAGRVVFLPGFEETFSVMTLPRLLRAGATVDRIKVVRKGNLALLRDRDRIAHLVSSYEADMLIGDPIDSYVDEGISEDKGQQVRPMLEAAHHIATETGCAVVFARHPGKDEENIMPGSRQWRNVPRSIIHLSHDSGIPPRYIMALWKDSMGTGARPVRYHLLGEPGEPKKWIMDQELDQSAEQLAKNASGPTGRFKLLLACQLVRWLFDEEEQPTRAMLAEEGRKQGLGDDTVYEALRLLAIRSVPPPERGYPWKLCRTEKEWPAWLPAVSP